MQVYIAGAGKLAQELKTGLQLPEGLHLADWSGPPDWPQSSIVVHAGSGRELPALTAFCAATASPLIELSTGSALEGAQPGFPVVLCPNTNVLMLKFMSMLARSGALFNRYPVQLTESHQAGKSSVPGTAVQMAQALGLPVQAIHSVRDPQAQMQQCQIPPEHLDRHAFHRITLSDGACSLSLETRVYGPAPYAPGVQAIIAAVHQHPLQPRVYAVTEFIELGWL